MTDVLDMLNFIANALEGDVDVTPETVRNLLKENVCS